jgi:hypothetical protein
MVSLAFSPDAPPHFVFATNFSPVAIIGNLALLSAHLSPNLGATGP